MNTCIVLSRADITSDISFHHSFLVTVYGVIIGVIISVGICARQ
jgi:hypothetical protein